MAAAARPTRTKTPATALVLEKNEGSLAEPLLGLRVGLTPIWVIVVTEPLVAVEVNVWVVSMGVEVVSAP